MQPSAAVHHPSNGVSSSYFHQLVVSKSGHLKCSNVSSNSLVVAMAGVSTVFSIVRIIKF
jgi:hypothetical protein